MRSRRSPKKKHVKQFPGGRICKKPGCRHRLSIYNSELYCHVHLIEAAG